MAQPIRIRAPTDPTPEEVEEHESTGHVHAVSHVVSALRCRKGCWTAASDSGRRSPESGRDTNDIL